MTQGAALAPRFVNGEVANLLLNNVDAAAVSNHGEGEKHQAREGKATHEDGPPWKEWNLPEDASSGYLRGMKSSSQNPQGDCNSPHLIPIGPW